MSTASERILPLILDARRTRKKGRVAIEQRQRARLVEIVSFARSQSPFYRALYDGLPERVEDTKLLPITCKKQLMSCFDEWCTDRRVTLEKVQTFVEDPQQIGEQFLSNYTVLTTSGTTGRRGIFVLDERSMAVTTAMALRMLGAWLSAGDVLRILTARGRMAMVMAPGGHFASAVAGARLRKKRGERVEILSVHSPLPELVARLNEFQPVLLAPYASVAGLLASEQEAGRLHINPVLISVTAEGLPTGEIERIARAFNAKVGNSYAATECPFFSYSCEQEWLHVNSDWVVFEPVDADHRPVPPGRTSHTVLVSNLANRVQPILRYDLGDSILQRPDPCPCGNPLPAIRVQGRASDVLTFPTPSGDKVRIAPLAFGTLLDQVRGVEMSQIVQTTPMALRVRLRLAASVDPEEVWRTVQNALTRLLSEQRLQGVTVERADEPPRQSAGGKYREVIPLGEASPEHERKEP